VIYIPLTLLVLWTFFLAYTALKPKWDTLRIEVKIAGGVVVLVGVLIDIGLNWTFGLILGVTKDLTLSQKCKRIGKGAGWRANVAKYICRNWTNPFDPGHC